MQEPHARFPREAFFSSFVRKLSLEEARVDLCEFEKLATCGIG
jgi:hypothetical protein